MTKPLSVVIITFNEERNIRRCLQSVVNLADEIVVVDSLSTDNTRSICEDFRVRFISQPFLGYIEQKNFALDCCTHEVVLSLDADEALDPVLQDSVRAVKQAGFPKDGYTMNRCTSYCGHWIRHGTWYPDRKLRIWRKQLARWGGINPHDRVIPLYDNFSREHLAGDIMHDSFPDEESFNRQMERFTTIQSKAMLDAGRRAHTWNLVLNPAIAFINGYFFKGGWRDGVIGFSLARKIAYQTFLKYKKLKALQ